MSVQAFTGLFVSEGTSDLPLADLVESLFIDRGVSVRLSKPDFTPLGGVAKDVKSRLEAGMRLLHASVDLVVVHRDSDNAGYEEKAAPAVPTDGSRLFGTSPRADSQAIFSSSAPTPGTVGPHGTRFRAFQLETLGR
ncbi:hypothetical protein ACOZ38_05855 [Sphaerisporangium viridialbum]|uniref:hypothetical protein n=1 Tax=Sphaerisporangium viridialbum TaxID=46189 RepID=UPI003C784A0E